MTLRRPEKSDHRRETRVRKVWDDTKGNGGNGEERATIVGILPFACRKYYSLIENMTEGPAGIMEVVTQGVRGSHEPEIVVGLEAGPEQLRFDHLVDRLPAHQRIGTATPVPPISKLGSTADSPQ